MTIDCDGQHQPRLIPELAAAVFPPGEPPVDIVSGSRYLRGLDGNSVPPEERRRINVAITELLNDRLGLDLTDGFCGFKAYRAPALEKFKITELGYAMPIQFWAQAAALGCGSSNSRSPSSTWRKTFVRRVARRRPAADGVLSDVLDREIEAVAFCPSAVAAGANATRKSKRRDSA